MADKRIIVIPKKSMLPTIGIFVGVALVIGIGIVGYLAYKTIMEENVKLRNEIVQFKNVTETLVRSSSQWTTKKDLENELDKLLKPEDLKALREDIKSQGAKISSVGKTVGSVSRRLAKLEKSDSQGPDNEAVVTCEDGRLIDVHKYTKNPQSKTIKDSNRASVANVTFDAANKNPWSYDVFEKKYHITTVISQKESGQLVFHHSLKYQTSADGDALFEVPITNSEFKQVQLGSKFFWLNPKLDFNFFAGAKVWGFNPSDKMFSMGVDIGLSLSSYGETKYNSWWRFFRIGLGYNSQREAVHLSLAPVSFNLGKVVPLISNLYITPQVGIDTLGGVTVNIGIGPQL